MGGDFFEQWHKTGVHKNDLIFGVVRDVGQLVLGETQVEGVRHHARATDTEIKFEMAIIVPRERTYAITFLHAETLEGTCQFVRSRECR